MKRIGNYRRNLAALLVHMYVPQEIEDATDCTGSARVYCNVEAVLSRASEDLKPLPLQIKSSNRPSQKT